eukprot:12857_1
MTKTRIVIKKVAAKRAPKRFKIGMKICIKNNKELTTKYDGVIGIIQYIGEIDDVRMCGIEILDDDIMGENNGEHMNGTQYFKTTTQQNKGIFISTKNIKKYIDLKQRKQSQEFQKKSRQRRRVQRNNAQMYGKNVDNLWQQRIDLVRQNKFKIVKKAGPREFGRIEYFGGDDEYGNILNDNTHFLAPRLKTSKNTNHVPLTPKEGPRDIGRSENYVGIEYDEKEEIKKREQKKMAE